MEVGDSHLSLNGTRHAGAPTLLRVVGLSLSSALRRSEEWRTSSSASPTATWAMLTNTWATAGAWSSRP